MRRCPGADTEQKILERRQIPHKTLLPSSSCQEGRREWSGLLFEERGQSPPVFKRQFQTELSVDGDTLQKASLRHLRDILTGAFQPDGECSLGHLLSLPTLRLPSSPESSPESWLLFTLSLESGGSPKPPFCWQVLSFAPIRCVSSILSASFLQRCGGGGWVGCCKRRIHYCESKKKCSR